MTKEYGGRVALRVAASDEPLITVAVTIDDVDFPKWIGQVDAIPKVVGGDVDVELLDEPHAGKRALARVSVDDGGRAVLEGQAAFA
jgi:hypothetical protein